MLNRVGIVSILFLGLILLSFLKIVPYPNEEDLTALLPALFLVMYFGSLGKAIVQMVLLTVTSPCFTILFIGRKKRSSVGLITVLSNQCFTTESLREVFWRLLIMGLAKWIASYLVFHWGLIFIIDEFDSIVLIS